MRTAFTNRALIGAPLSARVTPDDLDPCFGMTAAIHQTLTG
jgi:hypothetical protein